jgi:CRP-like cAMP-binding protein
MSERLKAHFARHIDLSDAEYSFCLSLFVPRRARKKTFLLQEGEICKYLIFVEKGCLDAHVLDDQGEPHIVHFAVEDWWITDDYSYWTGNPAKYFIETLEDSQLLMIDRDSLESLFARYPKFERYFRILLQNHAVALDRRIAASLTMSAEEHYLYLLKLYPNITQRISLKYISSYLGITPESLSRVRARLAKKARKS